MLVTDRTARHLAILSVFISAFLAILKIYVGLAAESVALVSDGFESGADFVTAGLVAFALRVAARPADEDHPYGHGRFETLTGLAIGLMLAVVGTGICLRTIDHRNDASTPELFAIWPLLGSIVIKTTLSTVKLKVGRKTGSSALLADGWNDFVDILSGTVALIAVLLAIYVPSFHVADHYGGFIIGLIVIFLGLRVSYETTLHLMDTMPGVQQMQAIRATALGVPGALAVEKCFARKTGMQYHVDLHLEVAADLTVLESHEIARAVKRSIRNQHDWVADVLVHVEPHLAIRAKIEQ